MIVKEKKNYDAQQWFRNGDHSDDNCRVIKSPTDGLHFWSEGKVVRYFRHPQIEGKFECSNCNHQMHIHGWLDNGGDGQNVCPGDYILREGMDKYIVIPASAFKLMYEEVA